MTELRRQLGLLSCTLLVAGNMIGIGIFVTATRIYSLIPNPSLILISWFIGGMLAIAGGLAYSELATRFPRSGGGYIYLTEAFGPLMGFLSGFSASLITIPGTAAFLAIGFTRYAGIADPTISKLIGITLIIVVSIINYFGVLRGARLQDGFMILKLGLIASLLIFGFGIGSGSWENIMSTEAMPLSLWTAIPLALVPIMYTYSGWDATVYVSQEIINPRRTIPRSMVLGAALVTLVYLALAALYLYALPVHQTPPSGRIISAVASALFSPRIGSIIGGLVAISVLGCLSATILTGPRVIYAMAKDSRLPPLLAGIHPKYGTPSNAIIFHAAWAILLLVTGTFDQLLDYITVPSVLFGAINVIGLLIIRRANKKDPEATPYLMVGYPIVPLIFVLAMLGIVVSTAMHDPHNSLWGLVVLSLGIPVYFAQKNLRNPR